MELENVALTPNKTQIAQEILLKLPIKIKSFVVRNHSTRVRYQTIAREMGIRITSKQEGRGYGIWRIE